MYNFKFNYSRGSIERGKDLRSWQRYNVIHVIASSLTKPMRILAYICLTFTENKQKCCHTYQFYSQKNVNLNMLGAMAIYYSEKSPNCFHTGLIGCRTLWKWTRNESSLLKRSCAKVRRITACANPTHSLHYFIFQFIFTIQRVFPYLGWFNKVTANVKCIEITADKI